MLLSTALREQVLSDLKEEGVLRNGWGVHMPRATMLSEAFTYRADIVQHTVDHYLLPTFAKQAAEQGKLIAFMRAQAALLHRNYLKKSDADIEARQESYKQILRAYVAWVRKEPIPELFPNCDEQKNTALCEQLFRLLDDRYLPEHSPVRTTVQPVLSRRSLLTLQR